LHATAAEAIQGLTARLAWLGLLHSLWLGLAAAALVALTFQARRLLSHRTRHALLFAALSAVALGPPALALAHAAVAARRSERVPTAAPPSVALAVETAGRPHQAPFPSATPDLRGANPADRWLRPLQATLECATSVAQTIRPFALAAWSLTVLSLSAVLALGVSGLNRLKRDAADAPPAVTERARKLGRRLRLKRVPAVRVHAALDEPCLCGVFRPVVLLPARWVADARPDAVAAVLAHELAHARRCDHLANLAQRVLEAALFFHPGVHWLSRSLRRQREFCTDALAVRLTGDPLALARALESVARLRVNRPTPRPAGAALTGEPSSLLPRIQELLGMTPLRPRPRLWPFAALPLAAALSLVALSVGAAGDAPAPAADAPPSAKKAAEDAQPFGVISAGSPSDPGTNGEQMVSYEVRLVDVEPNTWRRYSGTLLGPCDPKLAHRGWSVDMPTLRDLLKGIIQDTTMELKSAPRLFVYQNTDAFVFWMPGWSRPKTNPAVAESGIVRPGGQIGACIDLNGSWSPRGIHLKYKLSDSTLDPGQAKGADDSKPVTRYQHPVSTRVHLEGASDVPDGISLVFSLGIYPGRSVDRPALREYLVVITPRQRQLEPEVPPVAAKKDGQSSPMPVTP